MKEIRVSNRYANSVLSLAIERNELETVREDFELLKKTISENHELAVALKSPIIKPGTKGNILKEIFQDKVSELMMTFLNLLVTKGRENMLFDVSKAFLNQYRVLKNVTTVMVSTAIDPDEALRHDISKFIEQSRKQLGITGTIEIEEKVNPDLIGGFIIQAGDLQLDHSVKRKLDDLRSEFSNSAYISEL